MKLSSLDLEHEDSLSLHNQLLSNITEQIESDETFIELCNDNETKQLFENNLIELNKLKCQIDNKIQELKAILN